MKSPFKFLDSYTKDDRNVFFGRDQEITELYRRVFESKILLVYGVSGTGKSSLINCGLASRFDESDWLPVNVRRGNNIVESLDDAINKQAIRPLKKSLKIIEKLQSIYLDHFKPVYLVFDQFEELFIFGTQEERTEFIKLMSEIVRSKVQCRIVVVIREEFLAGITEFEEVLPEIFSNRFRVEKMKRANAILAVEGPCKVHGIKTEIGFSEELVDKLIPSGQEIELTFLQIYLDRIFRLAISEQLGTQNAEPGTFIISFSKELLTKAGSVSDLLGQFLEEQIGEMKDPEAIMSILKSFVSVKGTKKQMTEPEINEAIKAFGVIFNDHDLIEYLEEFVDLRILKERDESGHFELRHDALAAKIYDKFTVSEKELLEVRQFVENAFQTFNTRKTYLNRDDLEYLSSYEKRLFLPDYLSDFLRECRNKIQSQQRALRRLTSIVAAAFLIIISAGIQFYINKKGTANTKELTTLALLQEKVDPLAAISTAFKARLKDSTSAISQGIIIHSFFNLLQDRIERGDTALPDWFIPRKIPVTGSVKGFYLDKSGKYLFGWTDDKEIFTAEADGPLIKTFRTAEEIETAELSPDGKFIAVIYKNSKGDVFRTDGRKIFNFTTNVNKMINRRLARFFSSGRYFLAVAEDSRVAIYDSTGSRSFYLTGHTGRVNSLDISPDNRFVVTASCDKKSIVWNYNRISQQFGVYETYTGHKDTVWSCEFDKTSKYVVTASADSMLNFWDLNGNLKYVYLVFISNSRYGSCRWLPGQEPRLRNPEGHYHVMPGYYQKTYDAHFANGRGALIASNYSYDLKPAGKYDKFFRTQVIYWDPERFEKINNVNDYSLLSQNQYDSLDCTNIKSWDIAPDNSIFAGESEHIDGIIIVIPGGLQILTISGEFPEFSKTGEELFYIADKEIRRIPVNVKCIKKLVTGRKIFGMPDERTDIWKVI
jgi:WD40 repeat protein